MQSRKAKNRIFGILLQNFAAGVGDGDVAGGFAGDWGGRLLVEVGDGTDPAVGDEGVVVEVESAVLVADGLDEARAGRPVVAPYRFTIPNCRFPIPDSRFRFDWIECSDRSKSIRTAILRALGADALDDVGKCGRESTGRTGSSDSC